MRVYLPPFSSSIPPFLLYCRESGTAVLKTVTELMAEIRQLTEQNRYTPQNLKDNSGQKSPNFPGMPERSDRVYMLVHEFI